MDTEDVVMVECAECLSDINPDDAYETTHGSKVICSDCVRSCERCGDIGDDSDSWCDVDNEMWCRDCTENRAYWCDSCETYSSDSGAYLHDIGSSWCSDCIGCAHYCEDCDQYYADGCDSCIEESERVIHDYNYRPDAIFHSTKDGEHLFFGIEVEMESNRYDESSEYANQLESLDMAYLKQDGSLNHGFELVTHPMTHEFYKNQASDLFRVLEGLRTEYKVKSWDTQTCGVHIHISRKGFKSGSHMHRFLNLVYSNRALYEALAGRSSSRWAKFDDVERIGELLEDSDGNMYRTPMYRSYKDKIQWGRNSDRYSAVNTQNSETLEMRIFRGTVNGHTIKSHLDLAHASVEYTRNLTVVQVREGALSADSFMTYVESNTNLYPELNERMARLITPSVRLTEQNVSA